MQSNLPLLLYTFSSGFDPAREIETTHTQNRKQKSNEPAVEMFPKRQPIPNVQREDFWTTSPIFPFNFSHRCDFEFLLDPPFFFP